VRGARRAARGRKRADVQGLRALAVLLVIAAHAGIGVFSGGFIGVDVFFVISGYLITSLLLHEVERTGRVSIAGFYARRARRILPAAAVVTVTVLVWTTLTAAAERVATVNTDARWSAVFLANVHFAKVGTDYFADQTPSPFQHFWSLAVEEQFYLLWPLLILLLAPRVSRRILAAIMAGLGLASLLWSMHVTAVNPTGAYFSSPARAYELAAGAVLATLIAGSAAGPRGVHRRAPWPTAALGLAGLATIVVAALVLREGTAFPGWRALVPVLGTVALLYAGRQRQVGANRLLGERPLRYIGDISYSLYLWHWPVLKLGMGRLPNWWPLQTPTLVVISFVLAAASYRFVEQPFLGQRLRVVRGSRSLVLWPVTAAVVVAATAGATAYTHVQLHQQQTAASQWFQTHDLSTITAPAPAPTTPSPAGAAAPVGPDGTPTSAVSPAAAAVQALPPAVAAVNKQVANALIVADAGAPIPPGLDVTDLPSRHWSKTFDCYAGYGQTTAPTCAYGDTAASRVVAVVGDSHAGQLLAALDKLGRAEHFKIVPLIKLGCAAYDVHQSSRSMTYAECDSFRHWTLGRLTTLKPAAIAIGSRGELWMSSRSGASVADQWRVGVASTVRRFVKIAPTTVFGDVPSRPDAQACLTQHHPTQKKCVAKQDTPETRSNPITRAEATRAGAAFVDLEPMVCAAGRCPEIVGNLAVYTDNSHLSVDWSQHMLAGITQELGDFFHRPTPPAG